MANTVKENDGNFSKPDSNKITNTDNLPVRLILCFDGTGDTQKGPRNLIRGTESQGTTTDSIGSIFHLTSDGPVTEPLTGQKYFQYVKYYKGVGTDGEDDNSWTTWFCDIVAGATGYGCQKRIKSGYKVCCEKLQAERGDQIFIFGFSRGAFIARALASLLEHVGLLDSSKWKNEKQFGELANNLLKDYASRKDKPHSEELPENCKKSPPVRFLGAFDTVKAVYPLRATDYFKGEPTVDFTMDAPVLVEHFRHVLALNESRPLFQPDLWKAPPKSADRTYEEAWFFGHHHDIGGGSEHAGLALWPLQWMLHAATNYGLVLNTTEEHCQRLLPEEPKDIKTPHLEKICMADMMPHHDIKDFWLLLNRPSTIQYYKPRNYRDLLQISPSNDIVDQSLKDINIKKFLHPSAYLIFDTSRTFRIQVQGWSYIRQFMEDRSKNLIVDSQPPWWEPQTVEKILHPQHVAKSVNIMVYGRAGTGKANLVEMGFGKGSSKKGEPLCIEDNGKICEPIENDDNDEVNIYFSDSWRKKPEKRRDIENFIKERTGKLSSKREDRLHAIWFFLDCKKPNMTKGEKEFLKQDFGDTPVHVILANEDKIGGGVLAKTYGTAYHAVESGGALIKRMWGSNHIAGKVDHKPKSPVQQKIDQVMEEVKGGEEAQSKVKSFIHTVNRDEALKTLYKETFTSLPPDARPALVIAQRAMIKSTVALASNQAVRAYTIWYHIKLGVKVHLPDWPKSKRPGLSYYLVSPILKIFNVRDKDHKDIEVIHKHFSSDWLVLDEHKQDLTDETIPGDWILKCMVDTIIVMTYAYHLQNRQNGDTVARVRKRYIKLACQWYRANRKSAVHERIEQLLSPVDCSPAKKSFVTFQMGLLELVECETGSAEAGLWIWQRWWYSY